MIGVEENRVDALGKELASVAETVRGSKELTRLLSSPVIPQDARRSVMKEVLAKLGVGAVVRNAVLLLSDRRRGALVPEISDAYAQLGDEKTGKVHAEVASAVPLSDAQYARLAKLLEQLTGKTVTLARKVDPALIGGVVTRIGDKIYDGSVRTRLAELRQAALQS